MSTDIERVLVEVARHLDTLGLPYAVGGSVASTRYGEPRLTNDVDLLVDMRSADAKRFAAQFEPDWHVPASGLRAAMQGGGMFNLIHTERMDKVDIHAFRGSELDRATLQRRHSLPVGPAPGYPVAFTTAEDIVLRKLDWLRLAGGVLERQRRDVVGVLKGVGKSLDLAYLRQMAQRLHLSEAVESCLRDAGLGA